MKRGLLFTLSILLIAFLVIAIAILNFKNTQKTKDILVEIGAIERIYNIENSVATGFKEIFNAYSGINITLNNDTVIFEEFLPNTNPSTFRDNLDAYKTYLENDNQSIILEIDTLKNELPLIINPYNLTYTHNSFGGNEIIIIPDQNNYKKYFITIEDLVVTSCIWNVYPGNIEFGLDVNSVGCDDIRNIDITQPNSININNDGIIIYINNNLRIVNNLASVKVKTSIVLDKIQNERITVSSQENLININYASLNITKSSGFRII